MESISTEIGSRIRVFRQLKPEYEAVQTRHAEKKQPRRRRSEDASELGVFGITRQRWEDYSTQAIG